MPFCARLFTWRREHRPETGGCLPARVCRRSGLVEHTVALYRTVRHETLDHPTSCAATAEIERLAL
ncbi:hypothetical protein ATCV1_z332R [Acanthocystis turfacea chlorella virus 1]|uniref:Uncharacterized protein z332R n=1 Tax=Chlorovirus heliozoae TaxID=322019 RepID=A7K8U2_9PHYC|nr:hypothetical protein ATCV1_z332R [Acanthocystis turfacea chlorella virus 1]ABT16466.1 hypothetical protein ATCV1_z332R [Acanthocystis turfacea chlorella virus 1]